MIFGLSGGRHSRPKAAPRREGQEKPVAKAQLAADGAYKDNKNRRLKDNACSADCGKPGGQTRPRSASTKSCGTAVPQTQGVLAHLHKIQTRRSESGFPELRSHRRDDLWFSAGSTSFINCLSQK